jgi:hypothetical protein
MIWLFERDDQAVRVETHFDKDTAEYVAIIGWADGKTDTERFTDYTVFQARLVQLESALTTDRWKQVGGPTLIRGDWWTGNTSES